MRLTAVLCGHRLGSMFRDIWKVKRDRVIIDTGALKSLNACGIQYEDACTVVDPEKTEQKTAISSHPYNVELPETDSYLTYKDSNVLIGGLDQAKVFTNTVQLPLEELSIFSEKNTEKPSVQDKIIRRCIMSSFVFDAWQEKLPKRKDPERPAWVFPRDYGITARRKNTLLGSRMLQLCMSSSPQLLDHRLTVRNVKFNIPVERDGKQVLLDLTCDLLVTSKTSLEPKFPLNEQSSQFDLELPDIYPLQQTISLEESTFSNQATDHSIAIGGNKPYIHTCISYFDNTEVSNLHDCDTTEDQFLARSLMKCYTFALAQARNNFGVDVGDLPEPVTIQAIHTDSQRFHFSVLQLNTASCHTITNIRNFYWSLPQLSLFNKCDVVDGIPTLDGYNPAVFQNLLSFFYSS